jgi:SAM-dependent methyltransferase
MDDRKDDQMDERMDNADPLADLSRVSASYDAVAADYDARFGDELRRKVLDRAFLSALLELAGAGAVADVGCGSGQITKFLTDRHDQVLGIDLSPAMVQLAKVNAPLARFEVASMTDLPAGDADWAAIVSLYSVIHLATGQRQTAYREFARVLRPGGWLLLAFHIDGAEAEMGGQMHLTSWFDHEVDLTFHYLDPDVETAALHAAGFTVSASTMRHPEPEVEAPTRRCYLLAQRSG